MNIPFSKVTETKTGRKVRARDFDGNLIWVDETEEMLAKNRVLASGWLAAGPETEAFEKEFAEYVGVKYAIFTNSCTSALKMAYKYFKEVGYTEYYSPKNTFCATYASAEEIGLQRSIVPHTKSVNVRVHYAGIKDNKPNTLTNSCLIEDSAHRIEPNDPLIGEIRCYSFYATKNMTAGSGGMLVTNDKEIYEQCRTYWRDGLTTSTHDRLSGKSWNYEVKTMAGGYDGNDVAAAMGRVQLRRLPDFTRQRNKIRDRYNDAFGQQWMGNHLYPYFVDSKQEVGQLINYLRNKGVASGYHYPGTGWKGVSLPIYPLLTEEEQSYIINAIKDYEKDRK
jgi:dTDP-4-amino-4,6-dideoxygalactose transaminase